MEGNKFLWLQGKSWLAILDCYQTAMLLQASDPLLSQNICLEIEKEAMLVWQCPYAFGIDIKKTLQAAGFELQLDPHGKLLPSWFSMVLIQ
jgi:hypothetical protein